MFVDAIKSKMRLSISGYEDSVSNFKINQLEPETSQTTPFIAKN